MARKSSSTAVQEELYPLPDQAPEREPFDDARLMDLEAEQESPFLRAQKRVSVRRGTLPKNTIHWLKWVALAAVVVAVFGMAGAALYRYGEHSWRFRIDSSDQIEIAGAQHVTHAQIMEVMGGDIGRNIFFVPLAQRKLQLEQIPWIESASVMRFVPNRLSVEIHERTPVAFARVGSHISLIDAGGTLMELAPGGKHRYSFPVIAGMNTGEPLSMRAARMKNYNELVRQLDSGGAHYSQELSEVDLADPEDVKVVVADPNGEVLVHLGSGNYLQRYRIYGTHVQQWRQQFDKLESVDLRYDGQIIVNPDLQGMTRQPVLTPAAAKAAVAAGAKTAAIVNYEKYVTRPAPVAPLQKTGKTAKKAPAKTTARRTVPKFSNAKAKTQTVAGPVAKSTAGPPAPAAQATTSASAVSGSKPKSLVTTNPAPPVSRTPANITAPTTIPLGTTTVPSSTKKPSAGIPKETAQAPQ